MTSMTKTPLDNTKLLGRTSLPAALGALLTDFVVFAPTGEAERHAFSRMDLECLDRLNMTGAPLLPPKELLFPRSETLFSVDLATGGIQEPEHIIDTILFGVRPCDARSIVNLDRVFLEEGYIDSAYASRRERLTVIALACTDIPNRTCFCDSMGGGPADAEGADILFTETSGGDAWLVSFHTEKGRRLVALWQTAEVLSEPGRTAAAKPRPCTLQIDRPDDLAAKLTAAFEDPSWARFSEACLGCGTCSYICPTCYCFDIDAETRGDTAHEFRCWDCCMFSDYSRMAGGHDPRPTKKERLRNRYLHKLAYFDERYGRTLCVGCGRCISKCPAGLDIASVIEWGGAL